MKKRPKIKLKLTVADKILEALGWTSVFVVWILAIANYTDLPDTIPTHYNTAGEADDFGGKNSILILPLIATVLFIGITILNKFPHIFNYPTEITEKNALQQYTNATRMMRILKLILVLIFGLIVLQTIRHAYGHTSGLGSWFLPLVLVVTLAPTFYFLIKSSKTTEGK